MSAAAVEFTRGNPGCATLDSSTEPCEEAESSDRPRAAHELAAQVVLDGELADPRPLGPALEAVLRAMFASQEEVERNTHGPQGGWLAVYPDPGPPRTSLFQAVW